MNEDTKYICDNMVDIMKEQEKTKQIETQYKIKSLEDNEKERIYKKCRDNKIMVAFIILCIAWIISDTWKTSKMYSYDLDVTNASSSESHSASEVKGGE